jgi:hypothetical protein
MNDTNYVGEMSLKEVVVRILSRWRKIIIGALILASLFGGFKLVNKLIIYSNESWQDNNYENELSTYNENKKIIDEEIKKLKANIDSQNEYLENSIFMQIDHYNEQIGSLSYYIDTNYQINPKLSYQNMDNTDTVIKAYLALLQNGDLYNYIIDRVSYDVEARYLKEIFSIWDDGDSNMIYIQVIHKDKESVDEILQLVQDYLSQKKENISQTVGAHSINLVNFSIQQYVDFALYATQNDNKKLIKDYESKITEYETARNNLQKPISTYQGYKDLIRSVIKFAILGFILGGFILVVIELALIMFGNVLLSIKEYRRLYNIHVLGQFNNNTKKRRKFTTVDKVINRLDGNLCFMDDENENIKCIFNALKRSLKAANIHEGSIIITGTAHYTLIEDICKKMMDLMEDSYNLYPCTNINYSTETVELISDCKALLLVEEIGYSTYTEITREVENIIEINKKIIGTVIINNI